MLTLPDQKRCQHRSMPQQHTPWMLHGGDVSGGIRHAEHADNEHADHGGEVDVDAAVPLLFGPDDLVQARHAFLVESLRPPVHTHATQTPTSPSLSILGAFSSFASRSRALCFDSVRSPLHSRSLLSPTLALSIPDPASPSPDTLTDCNCDVRAGSSLVRRQIAVRNAASLAGSEPRRVRRRSLWRGKLVLPRACDPDPKHLAQQRAAQSARSVPENAERLRAVECVWQKATGVSGRLWTYHPPNNGLGHVGLLSRCARLDLVLERGARLSPDLERPSQAPRLEQAQHLVPLPELRIRLLEQQQRTPLPRSHLPLSRSQL
eukprot:1135306-Rhodomonas_salina.1